MDPKALLNQLIENIFIPVTDLPDKLPDTSGAYLICLKSIDILPAKMRNLEYSYINGLPFIYVGIAGIPNSRLKSLRRKDYKNHFNGTARTSTLRKSLGMLFDFVKQYETNNQRCKLIPKHEENL